MPTLKPADARKLADAEEAHEQIAAKLALARKHRDEQRAKVRPAAPDGEEVTAGGVYVKRSVSHPESFSLAKYKDAGHKVTAAMRKFVSKGDREAWTVKRVAK